MLNVHVDKRYFIFYMKMRKINTHIKFLRERELLFMMQTQRFSKHGQALLKMLYCCVNEESGLISEQISPLFSSPYTCSSFCSTWKLTLCDVDYTYTDCYSNKISFRTYVHCVVYTIHV
jgi:hypothetical protein